MSDIVPYEQRIGALSVQDVQSQVNLIQHVMRQVMQKDQHYGVIPGTGTKPTLLKAGAEKLCLTFRLDPQYEIEQQQDGNHLTIISKCILHHIPSGQRFGSGMGSCSTKESKYAYRSGGRKCPQCGAEAIIKGREEYGGGWICFGKKGGCGAKFLEKDDAITSQSVGRIPNEDLADQYNTVLKMANKRSLVAAVLNSTAASDIFTQDIEDMVPAQVEQSAAPKDKAAQKPAAEKNMGAAQVVPAVLADVLQAIKDAKTPAKMKAAAALAAALPDDTQKELARKAYADRAKELAAQEKADIAEQI